MKWLQRYDTLTVVLYFVFILGLFQSLSAFLHDDIPRATLRFAMTCVIAFFIEKQRKKTK